MEEEKWMELGRKMLYDKDIREPLFDFLEETYGKVRILEEKTIGKSRADVVMVMPESLYGIEIKSDADTYVRLGKQVKDYNLFYDYNYVAVGTSHALHVEEHIPEWWGIITVEQAETMVDFYILRRPAKNPEMNWKKKLSILWRPELAHIQKLNGLHKYKEKSKLFVMGRILEKVPEETLQRQLCEELFERDYTAITEEIRKYRRKNRRKNEK